MFGSLAQFTPERARPTHPRSSNPANRLGSAPLPHLLPHLDQLLDRPRAREMARPDPTDEVCAALEILYWSDAHRRESALQLHQILSAEHPPTEVGDAKRHDDETSITGSE